MWRTGVFECVGIDKLKLCFHSNTREKTHTEWTQKARHKNTLWSYLLICVIRLWKSVFFLSRNTSQVTHAHTATTTQLQKLTPHTGMLVFKGCVLLSIKISAKHFWAKPQQHYKASYISQPSSHISNTQNHNHTCLHYRAPRGISKRLDVSQMTKLELIYCMCTAHDVHVGLFLNNNPFSTYSMCCSAFCKASEF